MITTLGGKLQYVDGAWQWSNGEYEPRVRSMRLQDLAPNFRVAPYGNAGQCIEVPKDWRDQRWWSTNPPDADAVTAVESLLSGRSVTMIYAEGTAEKLRDHELKRPGQIIPIADWDAAMSAVVGASWDKADEQAIIERSRQ